VAGKYFLDSSKRLFSYRRRREQGFEIGIVLNTEQIGILMDPILVGISGILGTSQHRYGFRFFSFPEQGYNLWLRFAMGQG
jgi:hypothetical protein